MAETAALLADDVFPDVPLRQWVISFPFPLRYLFAAHPQAMGKVLGIVYRAISTHLIHKAGLQLKGGATGAVTLIQRFGNPQSARTLENLVARSVARARSEMDGYELRDHRSQQLFRPVGGYFPDFSSSVGSISEEIYSQQAVYLSST